MSILDSIRLAEEKNETLKNEANEYVNEILLKSKDEAKLEVENLYNNFKLQEKEILQQNNQRFQTMKEEIDKKYSEIDNQVSALARNRMSLTIDFILKKVSSI